jgi:hypothetical protein
MGAGGIDQIDAVVGRSPQPSAGFGLPDLPASVGFQAVMAAYLGSEVADPGLARRSAAVRAEVGDCVIDIDGTADRAA